MLNYKLHGGNCYNTVDDFYYQLSSFGSYDVKILIERANEYQIGISEVIDYTFSNYTKEQIFDEGRASINLFFEALYILRLNQLEEYTKEAIDEIDYVIKNDYKPRGRKSNAYIKDLQTIDALQKLKAFFENDAYYKIHLNACCSCFDSEILDQIDTAKDPWGVIKSVQEGRVYFS